MYKEYLDFAISIAMEAKKINEKYNLSNDFDVYNELSALCPYKEKEE